MSLFTAPIRSSCPVTRFAADQMNLGEPQPTIFDEVPQDSVFYERQTNRMETQEGVQSQSAFQRERQGRLLKTIDAAHFVRLKPEWADAIGFETRRGARLDAAVLSGILGQAKRNAEIAEAKDAGEPPRPTVISRLTVAQNLWLRWIGPLPLADDHLEDTGFRRFYQRCVDAAKRLGEWVTPVKLLGSRGVYGTLWHIHVDVTSLHWADRFDPTLRAIGDVILQHEDPSQYNVSEFIGVNFEGHAAGHKRYGLRDFEAAVARESNHAILYTTVGAFKLADLTTHGPREGAPCTVPWVVLDVDRTDSSGDADLVEAHAVASQMIDELHYLGIEASRLVIVFSGSKGFHVRIPHGALGCPVYANHNQVGTLLKDALDMALEKRRVTSRGRSRWVSQFDPATLNPSQPLRLIGTVHPRTKRRVVAFSGDEFMSLSLDQIVQRSAGEFEPFALPDPGDCPVAEELVHLVRDADEKSRLFYWPDDDEDEEAAPRPRGILARVLSGVAEGEQWHPKGFVGRHFAMKHAAFVLTLRGDDDVVAKIQAANRNNIPPIPGHELSKLIREGQRNAARKINRR